MKISINDENGSYCSAVLKPDGSPAVENVDFIKWEGVYHKNGKWSYSEGGIALRSGGYAKVNRSTHSSSNLCITLHIVENDAQVAEKYVGKLTELPTYPRFEGEFAPLFKSLFEAHLASKKDQATVTELRSRWETAALFF